MNGVIDRNCPFCFQSLYGRGLLTLQITGRFHHYDADILLQPVPVQVGHDGHLLHGGATFVYTHTGTGPVVGGRSKGRGLLTLQITGHFHHYVADRCVPAPVGRDGRLLYEGVAVISAHTGTAYGGEGQGAWPFE